MNTRESLNFMVIKLYCKLKVYESRYKHQAKISSEKLFVLSFDSIMQFDLISFISYKTSRKTRIEKFIFQVKNLQFYKKMNPFPGIPALFLFHKNTCKMHLLSKFLQQFQKASPKSCYRNYFVIILNEIMQKTYILCETFFGLDQFLILSI